MLKRLTGMIEQWRSGRLDCKDAQGRSPRQPFWPWMRGKYDAANTTLDNVKHWSRADGLSAATANSPEVRKTLRNRSRYEVANNSYARGITLTLANDVVGTGPRLQMLTADDVANRFVETEFAAWCEAIGLPEKLRTMRLARVSDGEAFALLTNNDAVNRLKPKPSPFPVRCGLFVTTLPRFNWKPPRSRPRAKRSLRFASSI